MYPAERVGARQIAQTEYRACLPCSLQQKGSNFVGDGHLTHHCEYRQQQPSNGSVSLGGTPKHVISSQEWRDVPGEILNYQSWDLAGCHLILGFEVSSSPFLPHHLVPCSIIECFPPLLASHPQLSTGFLMQPIELSALRAEVWLSNTPNTPLSNFCDVC